MVIHREVRLATVSIIGSEREPGVGKIGWHGKFGTLFRYVGFFNFF